MLSLGIFAKTFTGPNLQSILDKALSFDLRHLQFNMSCVGLPSLPQHIPQNTITEIAQQFESGTLHMVAVSATFNMIHPNPKKRKEGLASFQEIAKSANAMGTDTLSVCTGSMDPHDKWKWHPENASKEAWKSFCATMEKALTIAEEQNIYVAIEPEMANVVASAHKAKKMIDEMQSNRIKIILDPANLFEQANPHRVQYLISQAWDVVGEHVSLTHAKGKDASGNFCAPGKGIIPFTYFIDFLKQNGFDGPLIMHGLTEEEVEESTNLLRECMSTHS